jgi:hypothetical protein
MHSKIATWTGAKVDWTEMADRFSYMVLKELNKLPATKTKQTGKIILLRNERIDN